MLVVEKAANDRVDIAFVRAVVLAVVVRGGSMVHVVVGMSAAVVGGAGIVPVAASSAHGVERTLLHVLLQEPMEPAARAEAR